MPHALEALWKRTAASASSNPPTSAPPAYTLDALLAGVTDENRHAEIESGDAVGEEAW